MNHNPYNLQVNQDVLLDGIYVVKIVSITPQEMFTTVMGDADSWEVMTNRLFPLIENLSILNQIKQLL